MSFNSRDPVAIYQRLDTLENQFKKMSMLDEYIKQVLELEKRLGQLNNMHNAKDLEKRMMPIYNEALKTAFSPVQEAFQKLYKRMISLEKKMEEIEKWADETTAEINSRNEDARVKDGVQTVLFQEITVDKLFVDKYEQANNIGTLGVKELSGQMNIGATFENSSNPSEEISGDATEKISGEAMEKLQEKMKKFQKMKEKYGIDNSNDNNGGADRGVSKD